MMQSIITAPITRITRTNLMGVIVERIIMSRRQAKISNKTILTAMLFGLCGLVFLSGMAVFFIHSPTQKASEYLAIISHYEEQIEREDLSPALKAQMQIEQKKLMNQVWILDPFHQGFYNQHEDLVLKELAFHGLETSKFYP